ncbi:MAG: SDR family oxidoreductase [Chitinophagaceae bacterium]|nr:MAG: SDR family oxidoreductase [Chitinophagaceae bacterium]
MSTALITGASNGIGLELAKIHASKGDNLVLVARNAAKLNELKSQLEHLYKVQTHIIVKDLSVPDAAQEVHDETTAQGIAINYLINNAGFGDYGLFYTVDWGKTQQMLNLNILSLTQFTYLYLKDMVNQGSGRIMNVASTAAFQPVPTMSVYSVTKAFVLSFSEAVNNEVKDKGVTVTALCPGPTSTGFRSAAAMEKSGLFKDSKSTGPKEVADYGYKAMMSGKSVAIHGTKNLLMARAVSFLPRKIVINTTRKMMEERAT